MILKISRFLVLTGLALTAVLTTVCQAEITTTSPSLKSLTLHGASKYPPDFQHFDYVNPEAPKGGSLRRGANGTFDSLNPFISKGTPALGLSNIYDTLMTKSNDESFSLYPLITESVELDSENKAITFNINPSARFQDGTKITAEDVKNTFELLTEQGHPFYRNYYNDVDEVIILDSLKVKFVFKHSKNRELPYILAELVVMPKHFWEHPDNDFTSASLKPPLGSGPYLISNINNGRSLTYRLNENYWAKELPVNRGRYNLESISYEYYRDEHVALEAFKAGDIDIRFEYVARNWATAYDIPPVRSGRIILESIQTRNPAPVQGFAFNQRRRIFKDSNVRKALYFAMDFEWLNKNIFYNRYIRSNSYFENSDREARGIPDSDELALLMPYRDQLPSELFTEPYSLPVTDGSGNVRDQLQKALSLLSDSGWTIKQGKLTDKNDQHFKFDLLLVQPTMERVALPFKKNLDSLGITLTIRTVDISQYINRIRNFDYDMIVVGYGQSPSPGNEQRGYWGSQAASTPGSKNYMGIENPVIDAMIEKVVDAKNKIELKTAVQALDRVLLWGNYLIPHWYISSDQVAYSNKLTHPQSEPLFNTDLSSWWIKDDLPKHSLSVPQDTVMHETNNSGKGILIISAIGAAILFCLYLLWYFLRRRSAQH